MARMVSMEMLVHKRKRGDSGSPCRYGDTPPLLTRHTDWLLRWIAPQEITHEISGPITPQHTRDTHRCEFARYLTTPVWRSLRGAKGAHSILQYMHLSHLYEAARTDAVTELRRALPSGGSVLALHRYVIQGNKSKKVLMENATWAVPTASTTTNSQQWSRCGTGTHGTSDRSQFSL